MKRRPPRSASVICDTCGAKEGEPCRTKGGHLLPRCGSWRCTSLEGEYCSHAGRELSYLLTPKKEPVANQ